MHNIHTYTCNMFGETHDMDSSYGNLKHKQNFRVCIHNFAASHKHAELVKQTEQKAAVF